MIGVDAARARILASINPLEPIELPLLDALDLAVASDLRAGIDLPPFTNSAMDGFAFRAADTVAASDEDLVELAIAGRILAGDTSPIEWTPGIAIRIMTGATIPPDCNAVLPFEEAEVLDGDRLIVNHPVRAGANVRPQGEDVHAGDLLVSAGDLLSPARIGLLAAVGIGYVPVRPKPRVAVLSTGDELAAAPGDAQIYDANGPMLAGLIARSGGEISEIRRVADDPIAILRWLSELNDVDLIVSSGGISAGDSDYLRDFSDEGVHLERLQVAMKPGKPLAFGKAGSIPWVALPGNPVAAAVAFWQFALPAICTLAGRNDLDLPAIPVRISEAIENKGDRRSFIRARVTFRDGGAVATPVGKSGSGMLASLAAANALIVVPETTDFAEAGAILSAQLID